MRIGISSSINVSVLFPFIDSSVEIEKIKSLAWNCQTPAVDTLVLSFIKKGHFVRIFTMGSDDYVYKTKSFELFIIKANLNYIVRNSWNVYDKAIRIKKVVENNYSDLDLIHAHWTYEFAYALQALTRKIPVVCTVRDWAPYIWKFVTLKDKVMWSFKYLMAKRVYANSSIQFVANSPYTCNLLKSIGIDAPIIANSIKDSFLDELFKHNPKEKSILCISSSDDSRKNIISLLRAFKLIRKKFPTSSLRLVGGCFVEDAPNCLKYAEEGLLENVELCGYVDHNGLSTYLDEASVFVTPSLEETFGNTLLESMARKVPTVGGKDSGAVPYVLHQGDIGYLCDVSNPESIADTVEYIFTHTDEVKQKSDYAFGVIRDEYGEASVAEKYLHLYKSIISKK